MSARKGAARASKVGALGFTLLALVLTIITALLLSQMMGGSQYNTEPVKPVVVASKDVPASERINEDHLKVVQWPESSVPAGAFSSLDEILGPNPRVPVSTIFAGEPVLKQRLASPSQGTGMASLVQQGYRGFPVPVDSWVAEARLVYPGAMVDVLTTINQQAERRTYTKMVLQRVPVLAVDGAVDSAELAAREEKSKANGGGGTGGRKAVVTLLVTPEQGELLALASREGQVDLALRNARDDSVVETMGVDPYMLLGQADPEEVEEAELAAKAGETPPDPDPRIRRPRRPRTRPEDRMAPREEGPAQPAVQRGPGGTKTINLGAQ
ncbi:MAG: Flp pilus assembly protein CpaB [Myxococcales bacterium]|nr:Flp pilus assembly protein CpaB [Myxococcales bacterium]